MLSSFSVFSIFCTGENIFAFMLFRLFAWSLWEADLSSMFAVSMSSSLCLVSGLTCDGRRSFCLFWCKTISPTICINLNVPTHVLLEENHTSIGALDDIWQSSCDRSNYFLLHLYFSPKEALLLAYFYNVFSANTFSGALSSLVRAGVILVCLGRGPKTNIPERKYSTLIEPFIGNTARSKYYWYVLPACPWVLIRWYAWFTGAWYLLNVPIFPSLSIGALSSCAPRAFHPSRNSFEI